MADINIDGIVTWLKNWFYDKTEIGTLLNAKANLNQNQANYNVVTDASGNITVEPKPTIDSALSGTSENAVQNKVINSALGNKVDKVSGKGLSTNDYTTSEKSKLANIEAEANKTVVDSALSSTSENPLQNKAVKSALDAKADNTDIPTKVSDLTNDSGFITSSALPTKTSDLVNDGDDGTNVFVKTNDSRLSDARTPTTHNQASSTITEASALANLGTSANANQHTINDAINTKIGDLSNLKALEIVSTLPTASASTMNMVYIINEDSKVNFYFTRQSGTGSSATYTWEKMDTDILDELIVNWSDVQNKPETFTPSSHTHGDITDDGKITASAITANTAYHDIVIVNRQDENKIKRVANIMTTQIRDASAHQNIGSNMNAMQSTINSNIDSALGNKGALTDDVDWTYSSNGFTNGVKLVSKTDNANGRITLHLKS